MLPHHRLQIRHQCLRERYGSVLSADTKKDHQCPAPATPGAPLGTLDTLTLRGATSVHVLDSQCPIVLTMYTLCTPYAHPMYTFSHILESQCPSIFTLSTECMEDFSECVPRGTAR